MMHSGSSIALSLLAPETAVSRPAVDEHNGVAAFAGGDVVDFVRAKGDEVGLAE